MEMSWFLRCISLSIAMATTINFVYRQLYEWVTHPTTPIFYIPIRPYNDTPLLVFTVVQTRLSLITSITIDNRM